MIPSKTREFFVKSPHIKGLIQNYCPKRNSQIKFLFLSLLIVSLILTLKLVPLEESQKVLKITARKLTHYLSNEGEPGATFLRYDAACSIPKLKPFHTYILHLVDEEEPKRIDCEDKFPLLFQSTFFSTLVPLKSLEEMKQIGMQSCCYNTVYKGASDDYHRLSKECYPISLDNSTVAPQQHEFIAISCKMKPNKLSSWTDTKIVDMHASVHMKPNVEVRIQNITKDGGEDKRMNVVLFGIDAVSHMSFLRTMPKSYSFLMNELNAVEMHGYHKIGSIQSLDIVNEQILAFVFPSSSLEPSSEESQRKTSYKQAYHLGYEAKNGEATARQNEAIKTTLGLMRNLLLDAQGKFRKMVEENKALAGKLDGDLQSAHRQMALIRAELCDTNKRISQLSSGGSGSSSSNPNQSSNNGGPPNNHHHIHPETTTVSGSTPPPPPTTTTNNGATVSANSNASSNNAVSSSSSSSGSSSNPSSTTNGILDGGNSSTQLNGVISNNGHDALKGDRKRLKAEKFELLSQMKQLYATLEDKEKELRDFISNYEQRMRESESSLQRLAIERDEAERERWSILRHARDEAERGLALATQLNLREAQIQQLQQELHETKRQLAQYGIYSETDRSTSTNAASHYSLVSNLTATYATVGDRGSSADSGVRLSSDRDSAGGLPTTGNLSDSANEAISLDLCGDGSGDGDSMSVISTATLPQLFATPRDSPGPLSFSSLARSLETNALSRSAEQLLAVEAAEVRRKNSRRNDLTGRASTGAKGAWGSISRVFARNKHRRTLDPTLYDGAGTAAGQRTSWSPQSSVSQSPLAEQDSYADKLRALEEAATLPMELWRAGMVQAWIEVSLGMPQYGSRCADNIKSGKVLLELSDSELESELGITHPLHRKKLRLAIEEHRNPALVRFPCIAELSHVWVSSEWLPDIGLPQYAEHFAGCLVDARLLDHLSKKDLEKYLGVTRKFHMASIAHGVHLLRMVGYDRQALAERRRHCESDPLVWTNQHFVQWARSIDLTEYAENLKGSGVHGAICVLEPSLNGDTLASAMGIPPSKQIIRRHLSTELDGLLTPARAKITQQYRMTKSRMSTLEKQRSDSLGRSAVLSSEPFRRSTEDNRRRTSLRSYSHLFAQKGSLSRALGLKIKQDLHARRENEKQRKSEDRDSTPVATPSGHHLHHHPTNSFMPMPMPPPLPPGRPTRFGSGRTTAGGGGSTEESSIASSIGHQDKMALYARPQSALNFRTSLNSNSSSKAGEKVEDDADEESVGLTSDNTTSGGESSSRDLSEEIKAHRRATSISSDAQEHVAIHTPV